MPIVPRRKFSSMHPKNGKKEMNRRDRRRSEQAMQTQFRRQTKADPTAKKSSV